MNVALQPPWTRVKFFAWAEGQEGRYEFDGIRPVAIAGGSNLHAIIMRSLHRALDARLRGTACQALGPDAGLATIGDAVRYPDALVTCTPVPGAELTVPGVVCVFEIVSPTSVRTDHTVKVAEYAAVPSILRYVIIESAAPGLLVLHRASSDLPWTADALAPDDILLLPEIAAGIPVAELYSDAEFPAGL